MNRISTLLASVLLACAGLALPVHAADPGGGRAATDAGLTWNACPEFMPAGCGLAVLAGDPAARDADVFFRVPGGAVIPLHWHSSTERMVLVGGRLRVEYQGRAPLLLQVGQYARGDARAAHSAVCESREPCVLFIAFDGPVDAVAGVAPALGDTRQP